MDFDVYVNVVIQQMEKTSYYSELDFEDLKQVIKKYLKNEYDEQILLLTLEADMEDTKGTLKSDEFYKERLFGIKDHINKMTKELCKVK